MSDVIKNYFDKNGYVVLSDALSKKECKDLTNYMFTLYEEGKLEKDSQCPLSDSVYGDPVFDELLSRFAKPIGDNIGRKLLPTYTYCRIYRKGEILKRHKDRPSCEISATMTLGFDGEIVWPIFFDEEKEKCLTLEVGEMAVYKGCEILHWRPKFKGEWQVQVFFHYVDADGEYKDFALDGRKKLGSQPNSETSQTAQKPSEVEKYDLPLIYNAVALPSYDQSFPGYMCIDDSFHPELMFSKKECEQILEVGLDQYEVTAAVGGNTSSINKNIRSTKVYSIDPNKKSYWIFDKIGKIVSFMNETYYNYDLIGMTHSLQLLEYDTNWEVPGHYDWHTDVGPGIFSTRKLSLILQLSEETEYRGCDLLINDDNTNIITGNKKIGSVHLFPSYTIHKVTPIISGKRYSLVMWFNGARRFR
jgi:hypothetical protein